MVYLIQHIRSLIMILVCVNPLVINAGEYRRNLPVPPLYGASAGIGFVDSSNNICGITKVFFFDHKKQIIILATGIILLSVVCYMYKQNTIHKMKEAALEEMHSYIESLQKTVDSCIDRLPGCPVVVKKYFKESISKTMAEYIANVRNSAIRYVKKNKKYFISLTAAPTGMLLGYPVTGGGLAMLGVVYGAIQSAREEIAEFRKETEKLFAETNKNIKDGFENSDKKAQENKEEVLAEITNKTDELSKKIEEITTHIDQLKVDLSNKADGVSDKVNSLSNELGAITLQMTSLHIKIDARNEQDNQKDKQMNTLFEQLEVVTQKFDKAQENFVELVNVMIEDSVQKTEKEFKKVSEAISKIDGKSAEQANQLVDIQENISHLLDQHESDEKKFTEILDSIKSNNVSLEEINQTVTQHKDLFTNLFEDVQKKINENKESLLKTIEQTIKECSSLSSRMSQLELRVEKDQKYNKEMFEKLLDQNDKLEQQLAFLIQRDKEREQELKNYQEIDKKDKENLRNDLKRTATQVINQVGEARKEIQQGFNNIKNGVQQQITFITFSSTKEHNGRIKQRHGLKKQKRLKQNLPLTNEPRTIAEKEIKHFLNIQ